eukprot:m.313582 g.313582  ORF g.313582 m.313582 type:complete len:92 (-) comp16491_c7_seq1:226-501(-)
MSSKKGKPAPLDIQELPKEVPFDPRSPTSEIPRTPATEPIFDPRSPSVTVPRTPLEAGFSDPRSPPPQATKRSSFPATSSGQKTKNDKKKR